MTKSAIASDIKKMPFENALEELEGIVHQLEQGEAKLDDAIKAFERGTQLRQHCQSKLDDARTKIEKISVADDGTVVKTPFE